MRKSLVFFLFILICLVTILFLGITSRLSVSKFLNESSQLVETASALKLTDIFFSNDARYTRNLSQADLFSAFQDYPGSIEHFPSGSVMPPPDFSHLGTTVKVKRP